MQYLYLNKTLGAISLYVSLVLSLYSTCQNWIQCCDNLWELLKPSILSLWLTLVWPRNRNSTVKWRRHGLHIVLTAFCGHMDGHVYCLFKTQVYIMRLELGEFCRKKAGESSWDFMTSACAWWIRTGVPNIKPAGWMWPLETFFLGPCYNWALLGW